MKSRHRIVFLFLAVSLLAAPLVAQVAGPQETNLGATGLGTVNKAFGLRKDWIIAGKVTSLAGSTVQGAKVEVSLLTKSEETRFLKTGLNGEFGTVYDVVGYSSGEFNVSVTVTKKGFLKAHVIVDLAAFKTPQVIPITLRSSEEDPEVLSQAELISALVQKLKGLGPADGLTAKGEKDFARGVDEFLEKGRPDRALTSFAKVATCEPACVGCRTMLGLARLACGDWDGSNNDVTFAAQASRANPAKSRAEPFVILGVMQVWQHQPEKGASFFLEALKSAPEDPLALQELGRSQLLLVNWGPANDYLGKAVAAGAGPEARLLRVRALLGQGQYDEANVELTGYLSGRDIKSMPLPVRMVWSQIQDRKKTEAIYAKAGPEVEEPIDYLRRSTAELKDLRPAADQRPLKDILQGVGKNVAEFFKTFPNTSSLEEIHQEQLGRNGKTHKVEDSRYRYLCSTPAEAWGPGFDEYRMNVVKDQGQPQGLKEGFMLTAGFASAQILFHPLYQSQATFRYLGSQKLNGRDTWVVAFAQRPDTAQIHGAFKSGENELQTFSQGLAWVDSQTYQIVRLHSDLLKPLTELRLKRQTTEIDFSEVRFNRLQEAFWLPDKVTVTVDWNGHLLRNEHQYSEFKMFSVDSRQKFGKLNASTPAARQPQGPETPE